MISRRRKEHSHEVSPAGTPVLELPPVWGLSPPKSISTVAHGKTATEVFLMVATAREVFPDTAIIIYCEPSLYAKFLNTKLPTRGLKFFPLMTKHEMNKREKHVKHIDSSSLWPPAVLSFKMDAVSQAHSRCGETLFVDSDVIFLKPFEVPQDSSMLGLSPHYSGDAQWERKVGAINAGLLYVSRLPDFANWWRKSYYGRSSFFEQKCLESAHAFYPATLFGPSHNVGIWSQPRLWEGATSLHVHLNKSRRQDNKTFQVKNAEAFAEFAEGKLKDMGLNNLIKGVKNDRF